MPEIEFEPTKHEYRLKGKLYLSVTRCLSAAGLVNFEGIDPFYAERGTAVHRATELSDRGTLDELKLDPQLAPYLAAWRDFRKTSGVIIRAIEKRFVCEPLEFAGTIDRVVSILGREGVLDIKTGNHYASHNVQLAAYAFGEQPKQPQKLARWAVYLAEDGRFKLREFTDHSDFLVWQSCLTIARWKRKMGYD